MQRISKYSRGRSTNQKENTKKEHWDISESSHSAILQYNSTNVNNTMYNNGMLKKELKKM